jgi:cytochrome c peroxidase
MEVLFRRRLATGAVFVWLLAACGKEPSSSSPSPKPTIEQAWAVAKVPKLSGTPVIPARRTQVLPVPPRQEPADNPALVALGKKIFLDERLSEPPGTSCASCHDPTRAFSGRHGAGIGVPLGSRPGHFARRSTPSVLYMRYVPKFHYFEDDEAPMPEPRGGFFWDGRADSLAELVRQPLFNPDEMNAGTPARLAAKIMHGPYVKEFRDAMGSAS